MNWYITVLKKYVEFTGRAHRTEFWMFVLINFIISIVLSYIYPLLSTLYSLAVLLPSICVGIRRMHDTNHSGWWVLFPIVNIVFAATEGDKTGNRFGPDPYAIPT